MRCKKHREQVNHGICYSCYREIPVVGRHDVLGVDLGALAPGSLVNLDHAYIGIYYGEMVRVIGAIPGVKIFVPEDELEIPCPTPEDIRMVEQFDEQYHQLVRITMDRLMPEMVDWILGRSRPRGGRCANPECNAEYRDDSYTSKRTGKTLCAVCFATREEKGLAKLVDG